jgi:nitrous oxide reductase
LRKTQRKHRRCVKRRKRNLNNIEAEITALNYQSSKNNQDTLETLEKHKKFLEELSDGEFLKEKFDKQKLKTEELKKSWIKRYKENNNEDHITFKEEIEKQQQAYEGRRKEGIY